MIFSEDIKKASVIHIPHSSKFIPNFTGYNIDLIEKELELLTDHDTDVLFNVKNVQKIKANFSRIFCDVERLPDNEEEMFKFGRGFFYTHTDSGLQLRTEELKKEVYKKFYLKHHNKFTNTVTKKLKKHGFCFILDGHSFNDIPFNTDLNKEPQRPQICIGVDEFHTPKFLIDYTVNFFKNNGFEIKINSPYSGTIIPLKYYKKEKNVFGIMIEVNKNVYLNNTKKSQDFKNLMNDYFEF